MKYSPRLLILLLYIFLLDIKSYSNSIAFAQSDTSNYTVIKWDKSYYWIFNNVTSSMLSKTEIKLLEQILQKAITGEKLLPIHSYWKQFVPVINKKGQKEVWVNCFCKKDNLNWKKEIFIVEDGGYCFFNIKINLTLRKFYNFQINGYA